MRYIFLIAVLAVFLGSGVVVQAEEISHFSTDLSLTRDSVLHVRERIEYDFSSEYKHGIFRTIPTSIPDTASNVLRERYVSISNVLVTRDGVGTPFTVEDSRSSTDIKIGDAGKTVTGSHEYVITYDVSGALVHFTNGPIGLYWNAVGTGWSVPILKSDLTVRSEPGILAANTLCYGGAYGAQGACEISPLSNGFTFAVDTGGINGNITVQQEVVAEAVTVVLLERFKLVWMLVIGIISLLTLLGVLWYRFTYAHAAVGPVIAEYEPYQGVLPMQAGYIVDGSLDARDITAAVLYLAAQGYIQIERLPDSFLGFDTSDYKLTLLKENPTGAFLDRILQLLFVGRPTGAVITLSALKSERENVLKRSATTANLKSSLRESLFTQGFFERPYPKLQNLCKQVTMASLLVTVVLLSFQSVAGVYTFVPIILFVISGGTLLLFSERRSALGFEARRQLKGFALFLSVTGEARFAFQSDPRNNPDMFMEYLPYAVAFGVEKQWAQVFADLAIPQPIWYGTAGDATFNAIALTSSLDTFSTDFSRSLRAASTVQGTGGSSSSFGGGFSGGGGGGGGGGSW